MEGIQKTALVITIIGAINWGLISLFDFNLVNAITMDVDIAERLIYGIVGVAGLINIGILFSDISNRD